MSATPPGPTGIVTSADGTPIGWFREGAPAVQDAPPLLLVHGTTADHTTWRVFGPMAAGSRAVASIDRRGRGASGDVLPYAIEREREDVAAVARAMAETAGRPVDVLGHSYGGRLALGGADVAPEAIRRVVTYEGAVTAHVGNRDLARLEALEGVERWPELLEVFLREVVEMTDAEWQAFREAPVWPRRVAAAHTVVRELRAGRDEQAAWAGYAGVAQPVLQVLGSESPSYFQDGARALAERLRDGRIAIVDGARHAAHHTHPVAFLELVESFLDAP